MLCLCAYTGVHTVRLTLINQSCKTRWLNNFESKRIFEKVACNSRVWFFWINKFYFSSYWSFFSEYIIESKTDLFACKQLSSCSLVIISLLRAFCAILNSTYWLSSLLLIGFIIMRTQDPTSFAQEQLYPKSKKYLKDSLYIFCASPCALSTIQFVIIPNIWSCNFHIFSIVTLVLNRKHIVIGH